MEYIIFTCLLAYVAAVPSTSELTEYADIVREKIENLNIAMQGVVSELGQEKATDVLSKHKTSFHQLVNDFINSIPQETDVNLLTYKEKLENDLVSFVNAIFLISKPGLDEAQNIRYQLIRAARFLVAVPSTQAKLLIPEANSDTAESLDSLARDAIKKAEEAMEKVLRELDETVMTDVVID